jgi:hypothetical protein
MKMKAGSGHIKESEKLAESAAGKRCQQYESSWQ